LGVKPHVQDLRALHQLKMDLAKVGQVLAERDLELDAVEVAEVGTDSS
jgi:hypothetical protein